MFNIFIVLLVAALACPAHASLELVMVVRRHGARTPLFKNATTLSEGGASLTAPGAAQLLKIGTAFRSEYLDPTTCSAKKLCIAGLTNGAYDGNLVRAISSGFDRTLASSLAFMQGVFPTTQLPASDPAYTPIPLFSIPDPDDWLIRAYNSCPNFLKATVKWFSSDEFAAKNAEVTPLMTQLTASTKTNVTLQNFYNTFDDLNTQRDSELAKGAGLLTLRAEFQDPTWSQVVDLANWLESNRYSARFASNLCGGGILAELIFRFDSRISGVQPAAERFIEYSAHYPTQMCLAAAMGLDPTASVFGQAIPNYGAMMIFEMHAVNGSYAVALKQQNGQGAPYLMVTMPCSDGTPNAASLAAGSGSCPYDAFRKQYIPAAFDWQSNWCTACNNTLMPACQAAKFTLKADRPATYYFALGKINNETIPAGINPACFNEK